MKLKITQFLFIVLLSSMVTSAYAITLEDIGQDISNIKTNVTTIKSNVSNIKTTVTGNVSSVADEFKQQIDALQSRGLLLRETSDQLLDWLNSHQDDYLAFVGSQCGVGSPCYDFRIELNKFIQDFSLLSDRFPIIENLGMNDSPRIINIVNNLPHILVFTLYETMARMPDWNMLPSYLAAVYDEVGDPDVFSIDLAPLANVSAKGVTAAASTNATPTQTFCTKNAARLDNGIDPVSLNRIKLFVSALKTTMSVISEVPPKDQNLEVVGEGGSLPIPNLFKMIVHVVNFIQDAVQTYRNNIGICIDIRDKAQARELTVEVQVANCLQLVEFIMPGTRDEVYNLVISRIDSAAAEGVPVDKSNSSIAEADMLREKGKWKNAYLKICEAYNKIGY